LACASVQKDGPAKEILQRRDVGEVLGKRIPFFFEIFISIACSVLLQ
jgi:hypothetical protein